MTSDFLGGTVDKGPSANAGNLGSIPGLGRFHICLAAEQLSASLQPPSPCSRTHEAQLRSSHAAATEACAPRAHAPQQEKSPQ